MTWNQQLCNEKHKNIEKEFGAVWKRLNGQEKKLWAIILMLATNLGALVVLLVK